MKHQVFSIYDQKAQAFLPPFSFPTLEMAKRSFSECASDKIHMFSRHPQDFSLFHISEFDDLTGEITGNVPILHLGDATQYKIIEG